MVPDTLPMLEALAGTPGVAACTTAIVPPDPWAAHSGTWAFVTLEGSCQHHDHGRAGQLRATVALLGWDDGRTTVQSWTVGLRAGDSYRADSGPLAHELSRLVMAEFRAGYPDHAVCVRDVIVSPLLTVLAVADGWDAARLQAERVAVAFA